MIHLHSTADLESTPHGVRVRATGYYLQSGDLLLIDAPPPFRRLRRALRALRRWSA
jgi:hypothetical protein